MNKKDFIIDNIDQREIYHIYLGIDIEDINVCLSNNKYKISNPLRVDKHPSVSFKYYGQKLILRDFADTRFRGDVFEIVGYILNKNCRNPIDFQDICDDIIDKCQRHIKRVETIKLEEQKIIERKQLIIDIDARPMNVSDIKYFSKQGLLKDTIEEFIIPVGSYYLNGWQAPYRYRCNDPCYAYYIGRNKFKLYFPYRSKNDIKFITNNRFPIECINKLTYKDYIILTKAYKDNCLIIQFLRQLNIQNIQALPISGETVRLNKDIIDLLRKRNSKGIITLFDNDRTGIEATQYYEQEYKTIPWYFTIEHGGKDPTGMVEKCGYKTTLNRFKELIEKL